MGLAVCAMIIGSAALAFAGVPDLDESTASRAYAGTETLSLFNLPNGGGKPFAEAFLPGGNTANAEITLIVRDGLGVAVVGFPFQDMWIESTDGGLVACSGNAVADFNTNDLGETFWVNPLLAGGASSALCQVIINGDPLTSDAGLQISFNSPDLNADGDVNLIDAGFFTSDLFEVNYFYRSDFNFDNNVDLVVAGFMASGLGASCP
jgi:hypothetical protein